MSIQSKTNDQQLLVLFVLFLLFRVRKALLARPVVMECRVPWVCPALLDHLEYLERTETRPVALRLQNVLLKITIVTVLFYDELNRELCLKRVSAVT